MAKEVDLDDLTESEGRALWRYVNNRATEQDLHEAAQKLHAPVDDLVKLSFEGSSEERNERARQWLKMVDAAQRSGRIQGPALFLFRVMPVEHVHGDRIVRGECDPHLSGVKDRIAKVRTAHGLGSYEFWRLGEGPEEYERLSEEYDAVTMTLLVEALREFGLTAEAELLESDSEEFDRRREEGRSAMHVGLSDIERLEALRLQFEKEAHASALMGAFHGAAALIGAAMETALLAKCIRCLDEARLAAEKLPSNKRPQSRSPRDWNFFHYCHIAEAANWLPSFDIGGHQLNGDSLLNVIRDLRNMLHPDKQLRLSAQHPHGVMVARFHYEDAKAAYELLQRRLRE